MAFEPTHALYCLKLFIYPGRTDSEAPKVFVHGTCYMTNHFFREDIHDRCLADSSGFAQNTVLSGSSVQFVSIALARIDAQQRCFQGGGALPDK
jgi:hypothetical protein